MNLTEHFTTLKSQLNTLQLEAVEAIEGPVMVMAGPGTGKTQVLAMRVGEILHQTDTQPNQILALTFTESAATTMRERLVRLIGRAGYYVQIQTFHAFCSGVIQSHPESFPIDRSTQPLSDLERFELFEELLTNDGGTLQLLKPLNRPLFYLREVMKALSDLKRENVSPERFEELLSAEDQFLTLALQADELSKPEAARRQKNLAKQQELLTLYQRYQEALAARNRYDYDDMIRLVAAAFEADETLLLEYQEQLHYFLVDEYQDTNAAQNRVVDLLASHWGDQANIFVVGDPNQAIYRFQGASIENALGFLDRYPSAQVVTLEIGYRCPQAIYDGAAAVIGQNNLTQHISDRFPRISEPLESAQRAQVPKSSKNLASSGAPIRLKVAPSEFVEIWSVMADVQALIKDGVPAEEIAILFRRNRDAIPIQAAAAAHDVPYTIDGGDDVLRNEPIRQLLKTFELIVKLRTYAAPSAGLGQTDSLAFSKSNQPPHDLFEVLSYQWMSVPNHLVYELAHRASRAGHSMLEELPRVVAENDSFSPLAEMVKLLEELGQLDFNVTFPEWFTSALEKLGYQQWLLNQESPFEGLVALQSVFEFVKETAQEFQISHRRRLFLADFLKTIETMQSHQLGIPAQQGSLQKTGICLSTVHKAKGREWSHVFLVHCVDKTWGNGQQRDLLPLPDSLLTQTKVDSKERNEDDRRLFYVALTRARQQVTVSYPTSLTASGRVSQTLPSMFVGELTAGLANDQFQVDEVVAPEAELVAEIERQLRPLAQVTGSGPTRGAAAQSGFFDHLSDQDRVYLAQRAADFSLSVTALNTYLRDPMQFVLNSLLRVPRAKEPHMGYGTAMHAALEFAFRSLPTTGQLPKLDQVQSVFEKALRREILTADDLERRLEKGKEVLDVYLNQVPVERVTPFAFERSFGTSQSGTQLTRLDDIALTGRIDRIDWLDQDRKLVKVIDYKTGSQKSVNEIEGRVASQGLSERELSLPESIRGPYKRQLLFYKLLTDLDPTFAPKVTHGAFEFVEPSTSGKIVVRQFELLPEDVEALKELIRTVMAEIRGLEFLG